MIVRQDLKMKRGKVAAQCAHAALGAYIKTQDLDSTRHWMERGAAKIVLKINSEDEMLFLLCS